MKGKVSNINLDGNTFMVGDQLFAASPSNTVGTKLSELKDGDTVKVTYAHTAGYTNNAINALTLTKEESASLSRPSTLRLVAAHLWFCCSRIFSWCTGSGTPLPYICSPTGSELPSGVELQAARLSVKEAQSPMMTKKARRAQALRISLLPRSCRGRSD